MASSRTPSSAPAASPCTPPVIAEAAAPVVAHGQSGGDSGECTSDFRSRGWGLVLLIVGLLLVAAVNLFLIGRFLGAALFALGQLIGISAAVVLS